MRRPSFNCRYRKRWRNNRHIETGIDHLSFTRLTRDFCELRVLYVVQIENFRPYYTAFSDIPCAHFNVIEMEWPTSVCDSKVNGGKHISCVYTQDICLSTSTHAVERHRPLQFHFEPTSCSSQAPSFTIPSYMFRVTSVRHLRPITKRQRTCPDYIICKVISINKWYNRADGGPVTTDRSHPRDWS